MLYGTKGEQAKGENNVRENKCILLVERENTLF